MIFRTTIAVGTLALFIILMTGWFELVSVEPYYLLLLPLLTSFFHLTVSPFLRVTGIYKYLSPMLLVNLPTKHHYELHNGTSFDYLINIHRLKKYGIKKVLLTDYLKGLLNVISEIQNGELPGNVVIKGSSYFFSHRSAKRFGFTLERPSFFSKMNAMLNYLDLFWMYSLANKKWAAPNLKMMKTASVKGEVLAKKREVIEKLLNRIEKTEVKSMPTKGQVRQ